MKASIFLGVASAAMALAGPIRRADLDKRALETEWVVEMVTVTVTAGRDNAGVFIEKPTAFVPKPEPVVVKPTSVPAPPPPPPAPKPTTTSKARPPPPPPAPEPTTSTQPPPPPPVEPSPEPEPVNGGGSSIGEYEDLMLKHHNIHRSNHSAPAVSWDSTLAEYAQNTAEGCVFEHDMNQGSGGYGQNLASWGSSGDISSQQLEMAAGAITNQWYNGEVTKWNYYGLDNPPSGANLLDWGHFTQVVWKDTTKIGCATVQCPAGSVLSLDAWYTVCNYDPPGNFGGEYGNNVLEPKNDPTVTV